MKKRGLFQVSGMVIISGLTQVTALAKASVVASVFGAGAAFDGYNVALNVSTLVFSLAGTGITVVLIPALARRDDRRDVDAFVTLVFSASLLGGALLWLLRAPVLKTLSSGDSEIAAAASDVFAILLISQIGVTVSGVTVAYFQCLDAFITPKMVAFVAAFCLLVACAVDTDLTVTRYAWYTAVSGVLNALVQWLIAARRGFRLVPRFRWLTPGCVAYARLFLPTLVSGSVYQLSLVFDSFLAATVGPGGVSVLSYSNSIVGMLNSVLAANLVVYIYPRLAKFSDRSGTEARSALKKYCGWLFAGMTAISSAVFVAGEWGVSLLYERGQFGVGDTREVAGCLLVSVVALPFAICRDLFYRFFYANSNTYAPFVNSLVVSAVNVAISFILSLALGLIGIVLGTVVATVMSLLQILLRYSRTFGVSRRECGAMLLTWLMIGLAGAIAALAGRCVGAFGPVGGWSVVFGLFVAGCVFVGELAVGRRLAILPSAGRSSSPEG